MDEPPIVVDPWVNSFEELFETLKPFGATWETMEYGYKIKEIIERHLDLITNIERIVSIFKHIFPGMEIKL
jgi:hypothetical protein